MQPSFPSPAPFPLGRPKVWSRLMTKRLLGSVWRLVSDGVKRGEGVQHDVRTKTKTKPGNAVRSHRKSQPVGSHLRTPAKSTAKRPTPSTQRRFSGVEIIAFTES